MWPWTSSSSAWLTKVAANTTASVTASVTSLVWTADTATHPNVTAPVEVPLPAIVAPVISSPPAPLVREGGKVVASKPPPDKGLDSADFNPSNRHVLTSVESAPPESGTPPSQEEGEAQVALSLSSSGRLENVSPQRPTTSGNLTLAESPIDRSVYKATLQAFIKFINEENWDDLTLEGLSEDLRSALFQQWEQALRGIAFRPKPTANHRLEVTWDCYGKRKQIITADFPNLGDNWSIYTALMAFLGGYPQQFVQYILRTMVTPSDLIVLCTKLIRNPLFRALKDNATALTLANIIIDEIIKTSPESYPNVGMLVAAFIQVGDIKRAQELIEQLAVNINGPVSTFRRFIGREDIRASELTIFSLVLERLSQLTEKGRNVPDPRSLEHDECQELLAFAEYLLKKGVRGDFFSSNLKIPWEYKNRLQEFLLALSSPQLPRIAIPTALWSVNSALQAPSAPAQSVDQLPQTEDL